MSESEQLSIKIEDIEVIDRARMDFGDLDTLMASMKKEGQIQPIAVMKQDKEQPYRLLAGERRMRAARGLKWETILCRVYPSMKDLDSKSVELAENIHRKNLSWEEEVSLKSEIHTLQVSKHKGSTSPGPGGGGWTIAETAKMLGESAPNVSRDIKLSHAIEMIPSLKKCKTKSDAVKALFKLEKNVVTAEASRKLSEEAKKTPTEKKRQNLVSSYKVIDVREHMPTLEPDQFDLIEIDPPYAIDLKNIKKVDGDKLNMMGYNEVPENEYQELIDSVLKESFRVLKKEGWLIVWFGPDPWFELMYQSIINVGFLCRKIPAIWFKGTGQTQRPETYLASTYEMFFYARKSKTSEIVKQGRSNIFEFKPVSPGKKVHPTERPVDMMEEILKTFIPEGGKVFVPFLGSGNTLLATSNIKGTGSGCDVERSFKDSFTLNVFKGTPGSYTSYPVKKGASRWQRNLM